MSDFADYKKTPRIDFCSWLVIFCMSYFVCQSVLAATEAANLSCTKSGGNEILNLGEVSPLQPFSYTFSGTCTATKLWASGGYFTQKQTYNVGQGPRFSIVQKVTNKEVPEAGVSLCFRPSNCGVTLGVGESFDYDFLLSGIADTKPGMHVAIANIIVNPFRTGPFDGTLQSIETITIFYTVANPPCSLGSGFNLSLPFGTITSDDFANSQRIAEVSLNCPYASQVDAKLSPTQNAVSSSAGVSATTLDGLSMAATWVDNGSAVDFNSAREIALKKGDNVIRLGFRPQLNTRDSPAGEFSSQYTLKLTYR